MSAARRHSMAVVPTPTSEKKKRFSFFRRQSTTVVTIVPVVDSSRESIGSNRPPSPPASTYTTAPSSPVLRAASVRSSTSSSRSPARALSVNQVLEDSIRIEPATHADGLPTYATAAYPTLAATYSFIRSSPFAMILSSDTPGISPHRLYHISIGVNIWMPTMTVTTIRRGTRENGPVVASIELGISSSPATVTMGGVCRHLDNVIFRKSSTSNSRLYFTGDGKTIKWKMDVKSWQVYLDTTHLATFLPDAPRKLTLQPAGHRLSDHIMVALVILMREHLTPLAGITGDSAQLFNYSTHHSYRDE
ncbi:hypothetical protein PHLGIDRAFT_124738 [Phlebiopsis gigantea 11061_1 CR5-6]|uniref:DUF6593 domain-containing protein n=1 Tax=Phlebiopsis gigantea (strain 11061_1 CR5-6) TaxID=745531 RepID=A0A0C3S615_PHLG1|nr:hypothetical protein PHLGIDRAFT_124738 [Phlebiopsis gigantea 11061_1 CR5-6]